jgi:SAM-dependent methyltransferase
MFRLFKSDGKASSHAAERPPRHSRGWGTVLAHLKSSEAQRVLDFGATSPANINYLTSLGHSVYMANVVQDAARPEWLRPAVPEEKKPQEKKKSADPDIDIERFVAANLDFAGRDFDVILLWDTADYLPAALTSALFARLREVLRPGGLLLAFFHGNKEATNMSFCRYQLTDTENLKVLVSGQYPIRHLYQTRQIEKFLDGYSATRFFLGKDNVREVIGTR